MRHFYSTINGFDSVAQVAGIYRIEKTFKILGMKSERLKYFYTLSFNDTFIADTLLDFLINSSQLATIEKVPTRTLHSSPVDSLYDPINQWNLYNIQADSAWTITQGSKYVKIAIVDDGVYLDHEELQSKIWINQGEIDTIVSDTSGDGFIDVYELFNYYGVSSIDSLFLTVLCDSLDNDSNGYVDDIFGWDCSQDWDNNPMQPITNVHTHGTRVAGIIGAKTSNQAPSHGIASLGWNCSIIPIKTFKDNPNSPFEFYEAA